MSAVRGRKWDDVALGGLLHMDGQGVSRADMARRMSDWFGHPVSINNVYGQIARARRAGVCARALPARRVPPETVFAAATAAVGAALGLEAASVAMERPPPWLMPARWLVAMLCLEAGLSVYVTCGVSGWQRRYARDARCRFGGRRTLPVDRECNADTWADIERRARAVFAMGSAPGAPAAPQDAGRRREAAACAEASGAGA